MTKKTKRIADALGANRVVKLSKRNFDPIELLSLRETLKVRIKSGKRNSRDGKMR